MPRCDFCGNDYDKTFEVAMNGDRYDFDSFECAIAKLAPTCENCGVRIVGHGMEANGHFYCCQNCAQAEGVQGLNDRV